MQGKVMAGQRVRRLRRERGLTQARMAAQLGISTSYLNLIERSQRPVTVPFLLKLGQAFDIDLQRFAEDDEGRVTAQLREIFGDPLFARSQVSDQDIRDAAQASPALGDAVVRLFGAYRGLLENTANVAEGLGDAGAGAEGPAAALKTASLSPGDAVQEFIQARSGYFPELEEAAENLWSDEGLDADGLYEGLRAVLTDAHGLKVRIMPAHVMHDLVRRYDRHGRRVLLSDALAPEERTFQLAFQAALLGWRELFDGIADESGLQGEARHLLAIELASYFAGACVMPYERFHEAAETLDYDLDLLGRRFGASFEHVCQRLVTLQRPGAKGVPFFLVHLDCAGNVLRRLDAGGFRFARFGGLCPRWGVHGAFQTPGESRVEIVEMPDDARFLTIARAVSRPSAGHALPGQQLVVAIGCPLSHANRLVYGAGINLEQPAGAVPIGINCRLCDRADCTARAYPPPGRRLIVDENQQSLAPYFFA
ncbi:MAG: short-chain fatty acyl-CoA regulator family protein [Rhodospirillaceae bacterium]|nr:short-chain fatty acyl-CoA regulator family protein [Rhodospirillaceae bacterium]